MKLKAFVLAVLLLALSGSVVFASPLNNLEQGQSAVGITMQDGHSDIYVETQVGPAVTIGYQLGNGSGTSDMNDFYGQFRLGNEPESLHLILGSRNFNSESHEYVGAAIGGLFDSDTMKGYGKALLGSGFQEFQVGANFDLSENAYLNLNYRIFRADGDTKGDVGVGITCTF